MQENENKKEDQQKSDVKKKHNFLRSFFKTVAIIFSAVLAFLIILLIFRDFIIKHSVTGIGSWITGVNIELDTFETSLTKGQLTIKGFRVSNPDGFEKPLMVDLGNMFVDIDNGTLFAREFVIEKIEINDLEMVAEFNRKGAFNLAVLNDNLQKKLAQPKKENAEPETKDGAEYNAVKADSKPADPVKQTSAEPVDEPAAKQLFIKELYFSANAYILSDATGLSLPVPIYSNMQNISTDISATSLVEDFNTLTENVMSACGGAVDAGGVVIDAGKELMNTTFGRGKDIMNNTLDAGKGIMDNTKSIMDNTKSIWDSTRTIFKNK